MKLRPVVIHICQTFCIQLLPLSKLDIYFRGRPPSMIWLICSTSREPPFLCPPTRRRWLPRRSSPALPDDAAACRCASSAPAMADMPPGTATIDLRLSRGRHSRPCGWPWSGPRKATRSARSSSLHAWSSCLAAYCGTSAGAPSSASSASTGRRSRHAEDSHRHAHVATSWQSQTESSAV